MVLSHSNKPVTENVLQALVDWEKQSDRIHLNRVTVLECDDEALLEEVIRYRGMGEFVKEKLKPAVIVDDTASNKIKKIIEKIRGFARKSYNPVESGCIIVQSDLSILIETEDQIGEYIGDKKKIRSVTISTQILGVSKKHRDLIDNR